MGMFDEYLQGDNGGGGGGTVDELTVNPPPKLAPDNSLQLQPQSVMSQADLLPGPAAVSSGSDQLSQPPSLNYNNSMAAGAVNNALSGEPTPRGGSANPGLYGLLPQSLQHGTLRNVLGALGDAFLVGSGHQPEYANRMDRQSVGQAMAGYDPNDPASAQAAIQRIAATGAIGSPQMADQMQKNYNDVRMRTAIMQQTQAYRQQMVQSRNDGLFNRMNPVAQADLAQATSADDYAARLARWNQRLKTIDPSADAVSTFGVPEQYTPGAVGAQSGMTNKDITQSNDRAASRAQAGRDTDVNARSRIQAAGVAAGSRNYNTDVGASKPTNANILQGLIDKQNKGGTLTPAEQATFDHMTNIGKKGRALPPGLNVGGGQLQTLTPAQAHALAAKGGHGQFKGTDGKVYSY